MEGDKTAIPAALEAKTASKPVTARPPELILEHSTAVSVDREVCIAVRQPAGKAEDASPDPAQAELYFSTGESKTVKSTETLLHSSSQGFRLVTPTMAR